MLKFLKTIAVGVSLGVAVGVALGFAHDSVLSYRVAQEVPVEHVEHISRFHPELFEQPPPVHGIESVEQATQNVPEVRAQIDIDEQPRHDTGAIRFQSPPPGSVLVPPPAPRALAKAEQAKPKHHHHRKHHQKKKDDTQVKSAA
jgi:hypothetical protein